MRFDGQKLPTYDGLERALAGVDRLLMTAQGERAIALAKSRLRLMRVWREFHDYANIP